LAGRPGQSALASHRTPILPIRVLPRNATTDRLIELSTGEHRPARTRALQPAPLLLVFGWMRRTRRSARHV